MKITILTVGMIILLFGLLLTGCTTQTDHPSSETNTSMDQQTAEPTNTEPSTTEEDLPLPPPPPPPPALS